MAINNLPAFDAAVRAACPAIDGAAADGTIFFQPTATPAQIAAARAAAAAYVDSPLPPVSDLEALVTELGRLGVLPAASLAAVKKTRPPPPAVPLAPPPIAKPVTDP